MRTSFNIPDAVVDVGKHFSYYLLFGNEWYIAP